MISYTDLKLSNIVPCVVILNNCGFYHEFLLFLRHKTVTMKTLKNHHLIDWWIMMLLIAILPASLFAQELIPPQCYSGKRLTKEFIKEELVYPRQALENNIEGEVEISFIVNADGSATDYKISKSVSEELDLEALRITRKILWYPATEVGLPISYKHSFNIKFDIRKYQKLVKNREYDQIDYPFEPFDTSGKIYKLDDVDNAAYPVFAESNQNFGKFIASNLEYPEAAFKQNVSGSVKLKFVIEPSGKISNIVVDKALGGGCTEEAIRVLRLLKWYPAQFNKMSVRSWMSLEITFDIAKKSVGGSIPTPGQVQ
jgi:TonB family protein